MEGELAYQQDLAASIFDRAVHHSPGVIEDAQIDNLSTKPFDVFGRIGVFDAKEDQEAIADGGSDYFFNGD
jgi:hypothetical protein